MNPARVVVLGGFGNFGARICRALACDRDIEVIAAARHLPGGQAAPTVGRVMLDLTSADFAAQLRALAPAVVVHTAGPFQGQDYAVARAAIACGAHYVDIADGRAFVAGFAHALDSEARSAGVLALTGASSVPALSSAVVDAYRERFAVIDAIRIVIAPGQRAPRGRATLAGVFGYAGRPFEDWCAGEPRTVHGWQGLERVALGSLGVRWSAHCDVPDLALFPARYPGVRTVEFRAALELGIVHFGLAAVARLRRVGIALPIERWAGPLDRAARVLDRFGTDRGGMWIRIDGRTPDDQTLSLEWSVIAGANHGPEIPCMAAIIVARRLARGELSAVGADVCMGYVSVDGFAPEFERWDMHSNLRVGA